MKFITSGTADWKDTEEQFNVIAKSLTELGVKMIQDPATEGTDSYGFIFIKAEEWEGMDKDEALDKLFDLLKPRFMEEIGYEDEELEDGSVEDEVNRGVDEWVEYVFNQIYF